MKLKSVTLSDYKSISELESFELRNLNVLIGANGAGKSNFIGVFKLLASIAEGNLQTFVQQQGGPYALLRGGRLRAKRVQIEVLLENSATASSLGYRAALIATLDNRLILEREEVFRMAGSQKASRLLSTARDESALRDGHDLGEPVSKQVAPALRAWRQYHFHDTGEAAAVKRRHGSNDNLRLKPAADNLAAYLARLKHSHAQAFRRIEDTIRLAAPFFGGFVIRDPLPEFVELEWFEQGDPDTPYKAHALSDGTLRFICLTTLLLQPPHLLPDTVLIDEPELGLHPYAINLLADMLKQVSATKQLVVSTQSVELLNALEPEDVVVAERVAGATTLKRLDAEQLGDWLADYSLGELWKRNVLGGRPSL
jgi:predicted ATPase